MAANRHIERSFPQNPCRISAFRRTRYFPGNNTQKMPDSRSRLQRIIRAVLQAAQRVARPPPPPAQIPSQPGTLLDCVARLFYAPSFSEPVQHLGAGAKKRIRERGFAINSIARCAFIQRDCCYRICSSHFEINGLNNAVLPSFCACAQAPNKLPEPVQPHVTTGNPH